MRIIRGVRGISIVCRLLGGCGMVSGILPLMVVLGGGRVGGHCADPGSFTLVRSDGVLGRGVLMEREGKVRTAIADKPSWVWFEIVA